MLDIESHKHVRHDDKLVIFQCEPLGVFNNESIMREDFFVQYLLSYSNSAIYKSLRGSPVVGSLRLCFSLFSLSIKTSGLQSVLQLYVQMSIFCSCLKEKCRYFLFVIKSQSYFYCIWWNWLIMYNFYKENHLPAPLRYMLLLFYSYHSIVPN